MKKSTLLKKIIFIIILATITSLFYEIKLEKFSYAKSKEIKNAHVIKKDKKFYIYIGSEEILPIESVPGIYNAEIRARIIAKKINNALNKGVNHRKIIPCIQNDLPVVRWNGETILTILVYKTSDKTNTALNYANKLRKVFGVPEINRDYNYIASRSGNIRNFRNINYKKLGIASWYGKNFHGHKTADGSKFSNKRYTAAHKKLPFGTLVKVTNIKNNKTCIVKINDRGPYSTDRIIDLSEIAASEIEMISSGISKVKLEVLGQI